ncbi:hypothetical protein [Consotaella aegiceratis]|uniref:hypothetical protein n=1 Tax=Consotaella aegiceratis TaxID=3097961 RepID=UPI002F428007
MAADKPGDDEPKSERFNMFISKSEMDAIDEWAWKNRIRSKSEAVRRLVQIALTIDSAISIVKSAIYNGAIQAQMEHDLLEKWSNEASETGSIDLNSETAQMFFSVHSAHMTMSVQNLIDIMPVINRISSLGLGGDDLDYHIRSALEAQKRYAERAKQLSQCLIRN